MRHLLAAAAILLACGAARAEELELSRWSHRAPVAVPDGAKGLASLPVPPALFDLAAPNLADLRLVYDDGVEAPYVVNRGAVARDEARLDAELYNCVYAPGRSSSVTVDFGRKVRKNRVEIATAGDNFRRRARIDGSDDGASWAVVREGALLYRFDADGAARSEVAIPQNDMRYLRVTVENGPDDPEKVEITRVGACLCETRRPRTEPVPATLARIEEKEQGTEITLDLGYRRLPLFEVALSFTDENFQRHVAIAGRNEERREIEAPKEGGGVVTRTVDTPWTGIARGVIHRLGAGGGAPPDDESLVLDVMGAQYRYLRIRIENRSDRPLVYTGATVSRRAAAVELSPRPSGGVLWLYAGNPEARAPQYDLGHHVARLRQEGVAAATLGALVANPLAGPPKAAPWSERHRWILWAALLAAAAVMALLIWRQARAAGRG